MGGMAIVYKARDMVLNRFVAIKVLRDEFTTDEEFIKRFETEAQSAARLTHANIVSIYDVGVDNGIYYIVMELIQGKTLKEIIVEEGGPLPWKWSINVAMQIASALEMAHRNNIIHRDIKPHNIIITEDGVAKVTDFGIAKAVSNSTITAFGKTIGSVHYFSPEHARGGYTDAKSDLYSLGVVMYEMLTGRVPFDADTPVSVALKHMQETPQEPIELNPNIPEAVNQIIMKALKKEPELRYQTATEMLEDLKMALKNPSGNFVEQREYDPTAATQKIDTNRIKTLEKENQNAQGKKEGKFKSFIKKHKKLSIFIGIILLFTVAFGGTLGILSITNPKEVQIPNLVGLSKEEAQSDAESAKLKFEVASEEYNSEVPEGYVISQDPKYAENFNVKEGSTVTVVISKGTEKTKVPNVEGESQEDAIKMLEDAKLKSEVVEETSQTVKEGYVVSQETEPDTEVSAGDTIKIHVSTGTGIKQVQMVSVIGETEANARSKITALGLTVNVVYEEDSSKDNGVVLKQSVNSGTTVNEGTSVTITVNKIAETKSATANINIKEITGGYTETTNDDNTTNNTTNNNTTNKTVTVQLTYDGKTETRTVDKNESKISIPLSGKDGNTKTVTVTIKDGNNEIYSSSKDITFGQQTEIIFGR